MRRPSLPRHEKERDYYVPTIPTKGKRACKPSGRLRLQKKLCEHENAHAYPVYVIGSGHLVDLEVDEVDGGFGNQLLLKVAFDLQLKQITDGYEDSIRASVDCADPDGAVGASPRSGAIGALKNG